MQTTEYFSRFIFCLTVLLILSGCGRSRPWIKFSTKDSLGEMIEEGITSAHENIQDLETYTTGPWFSEPNILSNGKIVLPFIIYGRTHYIRGEHMTVQIQSSQEQQNLIENIVSNNTEDESNLIHYFHIHSFGEYTTRENFISYKHTQGCSDHVTPQVSEDRVLEINDEQLIINTNFIAQYWSKAKDSDANKTIIVGCLPSDLNNNFVDQTEEYKNLLQQDIIQTQEEYDQINSTDKPPLVLPPSMFDLLAKLPSV